MCKQRPASKLDNFFFRGVCIVLMLCSLLEVGELQIHFSISPEDLRFASMRCLNDYPHASTVWSSYGTSSDNHDTDCYVKCLLRRLGIIELRTLALDMNRLLIVWENINLEVECTSLSYQLDGTCHSYYRVFEEFRRKCSTLFKSTFRETTPSENILLKNPLPQWKIVGVTATEFCDSIATEVNVGANISLANATNLKQEGRRNGQLACIFKHFHYFDAYGRIDESEILRSFHEANRLSPENSKIIKKCVHAANSLFSEGGGLEDQQMAFELKTCLIQQCNDFKHVFLHRDNTSRHF